MWRIVDVLVSCLQELVVGFIKKSCLVVSEPPGRLRSVRSAGR